MTVNIFFQGGATGVGDASEQELVEQNIIEVIQLSGHDLNYIPRDQVNVDEILNEDPLAQFNTYHTVEMYLDTPVEYNGDGFVLGPHGLEVNIQTKWTVSRRRFTEETYGREPAEGDLIYWPLTKTLWEVKRVNYEAAPMWQLKQLYVYSLTCNLFTYTYQDFNTGIAEVDNDLNSNLFTTPFNDAQKIEDAAKSVLDFSEDNPFGDIIPKDTP